MTRSWFALLVPALILWGCSKKTEYVEKPVPVYKIEVTASQPNGDPRCTCSQSRGMFATNNDIKNARYARIRTDVADANAPHKVIDSFKKELLVPTKGNEFLGCSIETVTGGPACGRLNTFTLENEVVIKSNTDARLMALGQIYTPDIATCSAICQVGSPDCLALGAEMLPLVAPMLGLIAAADSAGTGTITKDELLKPYGVSSADDTCARSDVTVTATEIRNSSSRTDEKFCTVKVGDKPNFLLPVVVEASIPRELVADRPDPSSMKVFGTTVVSNYVSFKSIQVAPAYGFKTAASEPNLDKDLTDRYGGSVVASAHVNDDIIVATSNGCVSFPAPKK